MSPPEVSISFCPGADPAGAGFAEGSVEGSAEGWIDGLAAGSEDLRKDGAMEQWCGSVKYALVWFM